MNWTPSSRTGLVLAVLALLVATATPAIAVDVEATDVPGEATVGQEVSATFVVTEPFRDPSLEQWTLAGETDLENVTWTVTFYDQTGAKIHQQSTDGPEFTQDGVDASEGIDEIEVRVTGDVPDVEEYTYEPREEFVVATLQQVREGGTSNDLGTWSTHHYTADSQSARQAIESAEAAIAAADGGDTSDAEDIVDNAVSAYEAGNFGNALDLAEKAERNADQARQASERNRLLLYAVGGLVALLVLLGGGYVIYRSRQDDYDKLA